MLFEEDDYLEKIAPFLLAKIIERMDNNESWKKIQKCDKLYPVIKPPETNKKSPSKYIIDTLIEKICTMGQLRDILYKSEIYDALSIFYTETIHIVDHPTKGLNNNEIIIKRGTNFQLDFKVWGIPEPTYQWYKDEQLIANQTSSKLFYEVYSPDMEGDYHCIATQTIENHLKNTSTTHTVTSDFVSVLTKHEKCKLITMPPIEICRRVGEAPIILQVEAEGYPKPRYDWFHDNDVINHHKNKIRLTTTLENTGVFRCRITNGVNELCVAISVKIIDPNYKFNVSLQPVTEKVALLIGNDQYSNLATLSTPQNDTKMLQEKLESIGFLVLKVNNLTLKGMINGINKFKQMCCKDCIALFYYAGHGFEFGEKYLMPIDVPNARNYKMSDSICEYRILKEILERQPKLFVSLLDMCLSFPDANENPGIFEEKKVLYPFESNRNLLRGYATTTGYSAQEMGKMKCSFYNWLLQDNITKNIPIFQMLTTINSEFEELVKKSGKKKLAQQMPMLTSNLAQDYYIKVAKIGNPASKQILDRLQFPIPAHRNI